MSGDYGRYTARGKFVKEVIRGEYIGMALVRIGNTEIHVPFDKIERIEKDES